jgi:hypothetical protein
LSAVVAAVVGSLTWTRGATVVAVLLAIAAGVSLFCLTGVRVWTARRTWRRARNITLGR